MTFPDPSGPHPQTGPQPTLEFEVPPRPAEGEYIDDDEEWVNQAPKGVRVAPLTGLLLLVLVAVCGMWGGAVLQKHHDKKNATSSAASALASAFANRTRGGGGTGTGGTGGFGGFGGGATAAGRTTGTVTDVEGSTLYLTDASGNLVKITLAPSTKITKIDTGSVADLVIGSTVVVSGGANGSGSANTVVIEPAGTTPGSAGGTGGFGGGGGGGTGGGGAGG